MGFSQVQAIETDGSLRDWSDNVALVERETARMLGSMGVVNLLFS